MKKKIISHAADFTISALVLGMLFWRLILYRQWGYLLYSKSFLIMGALWIGIVSISFSLIHSKVKNDQSYSLKSKALWQAPLVFLFGLTGFFFFFSFVLKSLLGPDFLESAFVPAHSMCCKDTLFKPCHTFSWHSFSFLFYLYPSDQEYEAENGNKESSRRQ
jgi:hypothetical protein